MQTINKENQQIQEQIYQTKKGIENTTNTQGEEKKKETLLKQLETLMDKAQSLPILSGYLEAITAEFPNI